MSVHSTSIAFLTLSTILDKILIMRKDFDLSGSTKKRMLYLNATPDIDDVPRIVKEIAQAFDFKVTYYEFTNPKAFESYLEHASKKIDILYIASHGNVEGIQCNDDTKKSTEFYSWDELALILCAAPGLGKDTSIFLASCDAGFKRTALSLMATCPTINEFAALPCKLPVACEALLFHTYLHQKEQYASPDQIAHAASVASGKQLRVFSRYEMDVEIALLGSFYFGSDEQETPDDGNLAFENKLAS